MGGERRRANTGLRGECVCVCVCVLCGRVHVGARCGVDARIAPPFKAERDLLYHFLAISHFSLTRSGASIDVPPGNTVRIRAHPKHTSLLTRRVQPSPSRRVSLPVSPLMC